ncbi:DUF3786 domain-containing protein [Thermodesulfobacteriota bacterium]
MSKIKNPLELYKLLNKSNCRKCMLPSCMAFAVAVIQGQKNLDDCPAIDLATKQDISGEIVNRNTLADEQEKAIQRYRQEIAAVDLNGAAQRIDAPISDGMISIACLGKDFQVDATGKMTSSCHQNPWVQMPVLHYILHGRGRQPTGEWVPFNDLPDAGEWNRFFSHRCEQDMQKIADAHPDLFFEILSLFGAKSIQGATNADQSLVIHPLPLVPFLINYWGAEDAFASKLNILFDTTATDNSGIEPIYLLGRGLVEMIRKLIVRHSKEGRLF